MIQTGQLPVGTRLPPQRVLAEQLNVGRSSLREALSILETLGVVLTRSRLGTFVRQPKHDDPKPEWRLEGAYTPEEVYQFRIVVESYATRQAAIKAAPDRISASHVCSCTKPRARAICSASPSRISPFTARSRPERQPALHRPA